MWYVVVLPLGTHQVLITIFKEGAENISFCLWTCVTSNKSVRCMTEFPKSLGSKYLEFRYIYIYIYIYTVFHNVLCDYKHL